LTGELLTLHEAADRLGCHYMTLYRKVRSGEVDALLAGGRYRIRPGDLEAWLEQRPAQEGAARTTPQRRDWRRHAASLESLLLDGDEAGARHAVTRLVANGGDPVQVCERVLAPALVAIGDAWHDGSVSVAVEHRASGIVQAVLGAVGTSFSRAGPRRGAVVVATPPGNLHGIPAAMVAAALRADRFDVHHLGADVPTTDLVDLAVDVRAELVALSVTVQSPDRTALAEAVEALHAAAVPAIVGGRGIDAAGAMAVGADGHGSSLADARRLARELVGG
jgi:excisionase family DNA binding protein